MIRVPWRINDVYIPYIDDQTPIQIFFGGSSSGKSVFIAQRTVKDLLEGGRNYLIIRNTGGTNRGSTFNELNQVIDEWGCRSSINSRKSDLTITTVAGYQAIFCGLDDVEKIKSIRPAKGIFTDIWIEETTEAGYDNYKKLTKRLRGLSEKPKRITFSFNPIYRTHWICKEFFAGFADGDTVYRDEKLSILKTTHPDNRFLTPADRAELEDETNEYYYNVYTLGNWGVLGKLIFTNWRVEDLSKIRDNFGLYYNGLDYGYTNDPSALARLAIKEKRLFITHELYEYGMTNDLLGPAVAQIIGKEIVRCDPSSPKDTQELRGYGVNAMSARGGKGSVNHGIQFLQQFEMIIDRECQNAINEIQLYQWQENKDGDTLNVPVDKNNHFIDAARYGLSGISFQPQREESEFDYSGLGLPG